MKPVAASGVQVGMSILPLVVALVLGAPAASEPTPVSPAKEAEAPRGSAGSCAEQIALRVQARYERVERISARFEQRMQSVAFGGSSLGSGPTRGEVAFAKPGRMRWVYEEPEPSLVVSDGSTLWIYDPTAREAQSMPVDEGFLSGAAFQFLLGEGDILESFSVEAADCGAEEVELLLRPRAASSYELLSIRTDPATGAVRATAVQDLFGNRTEVAFQELRLDPPLDDALFRFEPPEGVRVEILAPPSSEPPRPTGQGGEAEAPR